MLAWGTSIVAIALISVLGVSVALVSQEASWDTAVGRRLWAGALANVSLVILALAIVLGPLRRGETWAFWVVLVPIAIYGIPILVIDATHVPRQTLVATLAPQIAGLTLAAIGFALTARGLWGD
jgi:hypothetical protein